MGSRLGFWEDCRWAKNNSCVLARRAKKGARRAAGQPCGASCFFLARLPNPNQYFLLTTVLPKTKARAHQARLGDACDA